MKRTVNRYQLPVDFLRKHQHDETSSQDSTNIFVIAATGKPERLQEIQRLTGLESGLNSSRSSSVGSVLGIEPLGEERQTSPARVATDKILDVNEQLNDSTLPEPSIIISADLMSNSLGKPRNADAVRQNLAEIYRRYQTVASMAILNKQAIGQERPSLTIYNQFINFELNPALLKLLIKDDNFFDLYRMLSMDLTGRFPEQIAGGFCAESLLVMKVITAINQTSVQDLLKKEQYQVLAETMYILINSFYAPALLALNRQTNCNNRKKLFRRSTAPHQVTAERVQIEANFSTSYPSKNN